MTSPLAMRFLRSAASIEQLPSAQAELALVGRSNVGKSSLLNALAGRHQLAKTSKQPGATRLLNVFELDPPASGRWLVDLPGYGFAKVPHHERRRWQGMIEGYLTGRDTLRAVLHLIDAEIGPTPLDLDTVTWLHELGRPVRFVGTKIDKVSPSRRPRRKTEAAAALGLERSDVSWVSAARGIGIEELRTDILTLLE